MTLLALTDQSAYNNRLVVKYFGELTMRKALESKSQSIGLIAKEDEDIAVRCICNLFKSVAVYFDSNLSHAKAEAVATEIIYKYEYRNLKLEDLVVICIRLKEAEIYKLTPARILREIKTYSFEREQMAIKNSINAVDNYNLNSDLESRLKKHFYAIPENVEKIASQRYRKSKEFKK